MPDRLIFPERYEAHEFTRSSLKQALYPPVRSWLASRNLELVRTVPFDVKRRAEGRDWPRAAETMIGFKRLDNLQLVHYGGCSTPGAR